MTRARVVGHPHEKRSPLNPTIACPMLTKHGEVCGTPCVSWCSTPVCEAHALTVYRAVNRLITEHQETA